MPQLPDKFNGACVHRTIFMKTHVYLRLAQICVIRAVNCFHFKLET